MNGEQNIHEKIEEAKKIIGSKTVKVGKRPYKLISLLIYACCLLVSFFIWLDLSANNVETVTREFSGINVDINGQSQLAKSGLAVFGDYSDGVTVKLEGPKNRIERMDEDDITAYIDVSSVTSSGNVRLDIKVRGADRFEYTVSPSSLRVFVDQQDEIDVPIEIDETFDLIPDSYSYEIEKDIEYVTVRGAKSVLDRIAGARAYVDLGTLNSGFSRRDRITFVDSEGKELDGEYFTADSTVVSIDVKVFTEKTVPLRSPFKYGLIKSANVKVTLSPAEITLRGDPEILSKIDHIDLPEIDETALDDISTGMSGPILPEGVSAVNCDKVERRVELLRTERVKITLSTSDISVKLPSDRTYSFSDKTFDIECVVAKGYSKRVKPDMFKLTLDASAVPQGEGSSVNVNVALADGADFTLFPSGTYSVVINVHPVS